MLNKTEYARPRPWYSLRLPGDLEAQYSAQVHLGSGAYIQSWLMVFIVVNVLSLKVDLDLFGVEAFTVPLVMTLGVFVPITLAAIVALRGEPSSQRQAAAVIVTGLVDMAIVLNSARIVPEPHINTYLVLAVIVPLVVGMIAPLSFRQTVLFCGASFALYVGFAIRFVLNGHGNTGVPLLVASLILVPLKLAYTRERALKQSFLLNLAKNQQSAELAAANARLTVLAQTDALTGIANRRYFDAHLRQHWASAMADRTGFAVASIDIDFFKRLNDSAGHLAGDRCIIAVADALRACVAVRGGLVARYGGEEFIALVPQDALEDAFVAARDLGESLREAVAALAILHPDLPDDGRITVSIGITVAHGAMSASEAGRELDPDDILKAADDALYLAKRSGRNRVEVLAAGASDASASLMVA
ncbi:GGDEF domain-containing protein [Methylobacterium sp. BTF04]|uniref:GGDEF domain-containing protein n=1 Tax=Methylobacterium sp. BTF04 TaxID=2708300 RepID=UPI0013D4E142|nr:GGDEF domain-containing protein [Methylobacterium sp. BTF04]NEU10928.1 GGDEF domain-containing protein [Methylobacterium sp. BTF04]